MPGAFRVLVTRADSPQQKLRHLLEAAGAEVLEMPTLLITPPSSWDPLDRALNQLQAYDWLILASGNAVTFFMQRFHSQNRDPELLQRLSIAVVGDKTAQVLAQFGLVPKLVPQEFVAEALLPHLTGARQVLFPRVESGGGTELTAALRHQGSRVDEVPAYESRCPDQGDPQVWEALRAGRIDVITFASSKTVEHFVRLGQQDGIPGEVLAQPRLAVIGPKTAATCRALLGRVDIQAQPYTLEGLVRAILVDQLAGD